MRRFLKSVLQACWNDKVAMVGGLIVALFVVVAIVGPWVTHLASAPNPANAYFGPSWNYPLGTDALGQSDLSDIILGARPIMEIGVLAATFTVSLGTIVGLLTGYLGGIADMVIMRITDVFLTVPGLPLIIVIASLVHTTSPIVLAAILSVTGWAGLARPIRSQALALRSSAFIEASEMQGMRLSNIIGQQLLPNVGPYVAIHFLLGITGAIYAEVGLFLLGIAPISGTNWGEMINIAMSEGALFTTRSVWTLFTPMLAIIVLQVAFVFFARAFDVVFNPRLRAQ